MSKIPRYDIDDSDPLSNGGRQMELHPLGDYVEHSDHLRAVTLAKIEVLKEMVRVFTVRAATKTEEITWVLESARHDLERKIAALRKELKG